MSKKIFAALIVAVVATFAGYNIYQSQRAEVTISDLTMANVEALARYELPEVEIVCNGGSYGMCQYCRRYDIYDPYYGWGYAYECIKTGDQEDWCASGCDSHGGGSFPG